MRLKPNRLFLTAIITGILLLWPFSGHCSNSEDSFQIHLSWQPVPGVSRYKVQISVDSNFEDVIEEGETSVSRWVWKYDRDTLDHQKQAFYRVASISEEGEIGIFSLPQPISLPRPVPVQSPISPVVVSKPAHPEIRKNSSEIHHFLGWKGSIQFGLGNLNQQSDAADLKSVSASTPVLQQRFALNLDILKSEDDRLPFKEWTFRFQFQLAPFQKVTDPRPFDQPNVLSYAFRGNLFRWVPARTPSSWSFGYGLVLDDSFRWMKSGPEAVQPASAFSAGPSLILMKQLGSSRSVLLPNEWGVVASAPLSGLFTGGQTGGVFALWGDWSLIRWTRSRMDLRVEGNFETYSWSSPAKTQLMNGFGWIAVVFSSGA